MHEAQGIRLPPLVHRAWSPCCMNMKFKLADVICGAKCPYLAALLVCGQQLLISGLSAHHAMLNETHLLPADSMYGHVAKLAEKVKAGLDSVPGIKATIYRVR